MSSAYHDHCYRRYRSGDYVVLSLHPINPPVVTSFAFSGTSRGTDDEVPATVSRDGHTCYFIGLSRSKVTSRQWLGLDRYEYHFSLKPMTYPCSFWTWVFLAEMDEDHSFGPADRQLVPLSLIRVVLYEVSTGIEASNECGSLVIDLTE